MSREHNPRRPGAGRPCSGPLTACLALALGAAGPVAVTALAGCQSKQAESPTPAAPTAADLPAIDMDGLEPALVRRLSEREEAVRAAPRSAEAWGHLGLALDVHGMYAPAITCYERAEALDENDFHWPYLLGHCTEEGDQSTALAHYRQAAALNDNSAPLFCRLGRLLLLSGDLDGADQAFTRALGLDETLVPAYLGRAKVFIQRGDGASAIPLLEQALSRRPRTTEVHALLAEAYRLSGNEPAAAGHEAVAGIAWQEEPIPDPFIDETWLAEGVTHEWRRRRSDRDVAAGDIEKFVAEWEEAIHEDPTSAEPHLELGQAYLDARRYGEALASFEHAIALAPDRAEAHLGRGNALMRLRRLDEAAAAFRRALDLEPDLAEASGNLGLVLIEQKHIDEGLELLRQSATARPDNADVQFNLAQGLRAAERLDEAAEAYNQVIAMNPEHARAYFERGVIFATRQQFKEAAQAFEHALSYRPRSVATLLNLAQTYLAMNRYPDAIGILRSALAIAPKHAGLLSALAWVLATCPEEKYRDGNEAVRLGTKLCRLSRYKNPAHLDVLAAASAERGDFVPAARYAGDAVTLLAEIAARSTGARAEGASRLLAEVQARLDLYDRHQPYRTSPATPPPAAGGATP